MYKKNEFRYSFESSKYLFHGKKYEHPPKGTTEVVVKDGVKIIHEMAFCNRKSLVRVTLPNTVESIECYAFMNCTSLKSIQLPPNLQYIGVYAFFNCVSLGMIYIPPAVDKIDAFAFNQCESLRIVNMPNSVKVQEAFGSIGFFGCNNLLTQEWEDQHNFLLNHYNPFHSLCWNPFVSPQEIHQYIQDHNENEERTKTIDKPEFTALHLLAANPSVTGEMITAYLQLAPDVAIEEDNIGMTPLHVLCSVPYFSNSTGGAIRAYLGFSEGKEAAFKMDNAEKLPFQYLCEKSFDELPFLHGRTFVDLLEWWYHCMGVNLFEKDNCDEEAV